MRLGKLRGNMSKNVSRKSENPWISEHTYKLIQEKWSLEQNADPALRDKIKEVPRSKRQDWKTYTNNLVTDHLDIRDNWLGVFF